MERDFAAEVFGTLHAGRVRARSLDAIARQLRAPRRSVEEAITELRRRGVPIASATTPPAGLYLPASADELAASNRSLHGRLREQYRTLRAQRLAERQLRLQEQHPPTLWIDTPEGLR